MVQGFRVWGLGRYESWKLKAQVWQETLRGLQQLLRVRLSKKQTLPPVVQRLKSSWFGLGTWLQRQA